MSNNTNENDLNSELHKISEWLASNKLSLNAQKNKFCFFTLCKGRLNILY